MSLCFVRSVYVICLLKCTLIYSNNWNRTSGWFSPFLFACILRGKLSKCRWTWAEMTSLPFFETQSPSSLTHSCCYCCQEIPLKFLPTYHLINSPAFCKQLSKTRHKQWCSSSYITKSRVMSLHCNLQKQKQKKVKVTVVSLTHQGGAWCNGEHVSFPSKHC